MTNALKPSQRSLPSMARDLRHLSRDKIDTLLLVLSCVLVVLTHSSEIATWVSASSIALLLFRTFLTLTGRPLPHQLFLLPIAAALMGGVYYQFQSFIGREAGVAMLILLLSCKMLEMHAKRDLFIIIFLSFFILLTSFFESQRLESAIQVAFTTLILLVAQLSFQFADTTISIARRFALIVRMLMIAIPLTLVCFFLFPRLQGPLWGSQDDPNIAKSGLSNSMSPGNISKLAMSEELAFKVRFIDSKPEKSQMYWKATILDQFDGRTWTKGGFQQAEPTQGVEGIEGYGKPILQEITLEANNNRFLFGLDSVIDAPHLLEFASELNTDGEVKAGQAISSRIRYQIRSYPRYRLGLKENEANLRRNLRLPLGFNPKTRDLAAQIQYENSTTESQVNAVLQYFRQEAFFYTLEPPPLGKDSADDFLFKTRSGFCEHYSSAFVLIMRNLGIPARVVTGYQGGTLNTVDGYLEVKQSDAHAWAEIWLPNIGWRRIDPTAAVAPDRIIKNLSATQKSTGITGAVNSFMQKNSWINQIRMQWSALNNSWNQWVLNYNDAKQVDLMRKLGLKDVDWVRFLSAVFVIGLVVVAALAIPLIRHRPKLAPIDKVYAAFCKQLERRGFRKELHLGPQAFLSSLQTKMKRDQFQIAREFIAHYIDIKYGKPSNTPELQLRHLKKLLKQLS